MNVHPKSHGATSHSEPKPGERTPDQDRPGRGGDRPDREEPGRDRPDHDRPGPDDRKAPAISRRPDSRSNA